VYVDAFNLYYGRLKDTPYRWLNLEALVRNALSHKFKVERIKYYTARVSARADDLDAPNRQQVYLRALRTLPRVEIFYGHFLTHEVKMRLARPKAGCPDKVKVIRTNEKGSDVNLATALLVDGWDHLYEAAIIVSNDSDLLAPVKVVRERLGKHVAILNPHEDHAAVLKPVVNFMRRITERHVRASQFPPTLQDEAGSFSKPAAW